MDGFTDEENFYDDDDLDDLPHEKFTELENDAIQYTQAQTQARLRVDTISDYGNDLEDDDLKDAAMSDECSSTQLIVPSFQQNITAVTTGSQNNERTDSPNPSYGHETSLSLRNIKASQHEILIKHQAFQSDSVNAQVISLQKQVEDLISERDSLKQDLFSKTGEVAIVRNKQEKTVQDYERQLLALQKLNTEKLERQQKELDIARASEKNTAIDREFIKRDLAEESERVRRLNRAREKRRESNPKFAVTPKRRKILSIRDGFNDDEIKFLSPSNYSPSKSLKDLTGSPSRMTKMKTDESPEGTLNPTIFDDFQTLDKDPMSAIFDQITLSNLTIENDRLDFIGTILDHCVDKKHLRTIQELGKYALPSAPHQNLQGLIIAKISDLCRKRPIIDPPLGVCNILIKIWIDCVEEKYFEPLYLLIDWLELALELKTSFLAPQLVDSVLPIAQRTADFIAIPRFQSQPIEKLDRYINLSACMSLIYSISLGCMANPQDITRFWKLMRWDFVLLMLSTNQFERDYDLILRLLSTSTMKHSFGALPGGEKQDLQTGWIIDRLTYPLNEHPCIPMSTEKFNSKILSKVRLKILQIMTRMSKSSYASKALATHTHAIGRLVCLISDEIDLLYDFYYEDGYSAEIINTAMRLLYHLVTKHECAIEIQQNLSYVHGGSQKYLLSLSRLNFLEEDLVLESGIDSDVPGFALELLELIVTPEEGDAIQSAFSNQLILCDQ
ncbi:putative dna repair protein rad26 [Golovinomyces cichoracearum]|uniref:Putative dna repair protein rad26 n=1 Tax=Golovinomyces cichoracearum TaxID=62708 RepID=A0A420HIK1_9PEZI|nr:putative dna repair protein rad26 [Golovinomyces cichoracearum]